MAKAKARTTSTLTTPVTVNNPFLPHFNLKLDFTESNQAKFSHDKNSLWIYIQKLPVSFELSEFEPTLFLSYTPTLDFSDEHVIHDPSEPTKGSFSDECTFMEDTVKIDGYYIFSFSMAKWKHILQQNGDGMIGLNFLRRNSTTQTITSFGAQFSIEIDEMKMYSDDDTNDMDTLILNWDIENNEMVEVISDSDANLLKKVDGLTSHNLQDLYLGHVADRTFDPEKPIEIVLKTNDDDTSSISRSNTFPSTSKNGSDFVVEVTVPLSGCQVQKDAVVDNSVSSHSKVRSSKSTSRPTFQAIEGVNVFALKPNGSLFEFVGGESMWKKVNNQKFKHVAISGDKVHSYAITEYDDIFYNFNGLTNSSGWTKIAGSLVQISQNKNGRHVWGVNANGQVFYRKGMRNNDWTMIKNGPKIKFVAVSGNGLSIYGIHRNGNLFYRNGVEAGCWKRVSPGMKFKCISVNVNGKILWAINEKDKVYCKIDDKEWINVPGRLTTITQCEKGEHIWGVDSYRNVYYRSGKDLKSGWKKVPGDFDLVACSGHSSMDEITIKDAIVTILPNAIQVDISLTSCFNRVIEYDSKSGYFGFPDNIKDIALALVTGSKGDLDDEELIHGQELLLKALKFPSCCLLQSRQGESIDVKLSGLDSNKIFVDRVDRALSFAQSEQDLIDWSNSTFYCSTSEDFAIHPEVELNVNIQDFGQVANDTHSFDVTFDLPSNINVHQEEAILTPDNVWLFVELDDTSFFDVGTNDKTSMEIFQSKYSQNSWSFSWSSQHQNRISRTSFIKVAIFLKSEDRFYRYGKSASFIINTNQEQHRAKLILQDTNALINLSIDESYHDLKDYLKSIVSLMLQIATSDISSMTRDSAAKSLALTFMTFPSLYTDEIDLSTNINDIISRCVNSFKDKILAAANPDNLVSTITKALGTNRKIDHDAIYYFFTMSRSDIRKWLDDNDSKLLADLSGNILMNVMIQIDKGVIVQRTTLNEPASVQLPIRSDNARIIDLSVPMSARVSNNVQPPIRSENVRTIDLSLPMSDQASEDEVSLDIFIQKIEANEISIETVTSHLGAITAVSDQLLDPLNQLSSFSDTFSYLVDTAQSFQRVLGILERSCDFIARCPIGFLASAFKLGKVAMGSLKRVTSVAINQIQTVERQGNERCQKMLAKGDELNKVNEKLRKPIDALDQILGILQTVKLLLTFGVFSGGILSSFFSYNSLDDFFNDFQGKMKYVVDTFKNWLGTLEPLKDRISNVKNFVDIVASKVRHANVLSGPFSTLSHLGQRMINAIRSMTRWWFPAKAVFDMMMRLMNFPISYAMSLIGGAVDTVLYNLNPFNSAVVNIVANSISNLTNIQSITTCLNEIFNVQQRFHSVENIFLKLAVFLVKGILEFQAFTLSSTASSISALQSTGFNLDSLMQEISFLKATKGEQYDVSDYLIDLKERTFDVHITKCNSILTSSSNDLVVNGRALTKKETSSNKLFDQIFCCCTKSKVEQSDDGNNDEEEELVSQQDLEEFAKIPNTLGLTQPSQQKDYFSKWDWFLVPVASYAFYATIIDQVITATQDSDDNELYDTVSVQKLKEFKKSVTVKDSKFFFPFYAYDQTELTSHRMEVVINVQDTLVSQRSIGSSDVDFFNNMINYIFDKALENINGTRQARTRSNINRNFRCNVSSQIIDKVLAQSLGIYGEELVPSAFRILADFSSQSFYKKVDGENKWRSYEISQKPAKNDSHPDKFDRVSFDQITEMDSTYTDDELLEIMRSKTISKEELITLKTPHSTNNQALFSRKMKEKIGSLSIFIIQNQSKLKYVTSIDECDECDNCIMIGNEDTNSIGTGVKMKDLSSDGTIIWEFKLQSNRELQSSSSVQSRSLNANKQLPNEESLYEIVPRSYEDILTIIVDKTFEVIQNLTSRGYIVSRSNGAILDEELLAYTRDLTAAGATIFRREVKQGDYVTYRRKYPTLNLVGVNSVGVGYVNKIEKNRAKTTYFIHALKIDEATGRLHKINNILPEVEIIVPTELATEAMKNAYNENQVALSWDKKTINAAVMRHRKFGNSPFPIFADVASAKNKGSNPQWKLKKTASWMLTAKQFLDILNFCRTTYPNIWTYMGVRKAAFYANKGYAQIDDLNDFFIWPMTEGTGMGLALNMQPATADYLGVKPKEPREKGDSVILSHAWAQDVDELTEIIRNNIHRGTRLSFGKRFTATTKLWFCAFAHYQNDSKDSIGPTLNDQLSTDPIPWTAALRDSPKLPHECLITDMMIIVTEKMDPFNRWYCVMEFWEAKRRHLLSSGYPDLQVHHQVSSRYIDLMVNKVDPRRPDTWRLRTEDEFNQYIAAAEPRRFPSILKYRPDSEAVTLTFFQDPSRNSEAYRKIRAQMYQFESEGERGHKAIDNETTKIRDGTLAIARQEFLRNGF